MADAAVNENEQEEEEEPVYFGSVRTYKSSDIKVMGRIGRGNFGEIRLGEIINGRKQDRKERNKREQTIRVAVKTLHIGGGLADEELKELQVLSRLKIHRNVLRFYGVATLEKKLAFLTEYCEKGSLDKLHFKEDMVSWQPFLRIATDVLSGLKHLHSQDPPCIHRDIACRNLLMRADGSVVVGDYGLARSITSRYATYQKLAAHTAWAWTAPESYKGIYSIRSDMWMFGVAIFEILSKGSVPYGELSFHYAVPKIMNGSLCLKLKRRRTRKTSSSSSNSSSDEEVDDRCKTIMEMCLQLEARKRPSATMLLRYLTTESSTQEHQIKTLAALIKQEREMGDGGGTLASNYASLSENDFEMQETERGNETANSDNDNDTDNRGGGDDDDDAGNKNDYKAVSDNVKDSRRTQSSMRANRLLLSSARDGDLNGVIRAFNMGANPNEARDTDQHKSTALIYAVSDPTCYDPEVAAFIVEMKADLQLKDGSGFDALTAACHYGLTSAVKYLVEAKANPKAGTPLINAADNYRLEIVRYLLEEVKVDISLRDNYGLTALDAAIQNIHLRDLQLVRYLLEMKAPINKNVHDSVCEIEHERGDAASLVRNHHQQRVCLKILQRDSPRISMLHSDIIAALTEKVSTWYLG
mmetsp:Transcript_40272/g.64719  ORF Transcript_40272/g.64719 Transcript_40272/m.64719 type:complete len:641 (-) Transcript_40272:157-2079(-)